jgi:diaminohydroxyphosphoribosylaminopyrimidine deaminase/5-amino-6-(5-phosphoribosylamino)uracil reductase
MHNDHGNWVLTSTQRALARWMLDRAALIGVRGFGKVEPNPMVGCVIARTLTDNALIPADASSLILGRGYHRLFGGPHAEAEAIADARARGHDLQGSTAYVTLEPCNSKGRNPACVDGLLQAGVARVVYARHDPHPLTPGSKSGGAQRLMRSGVKVALTTISPAATALAESFITRIQRATSPHEAASPSMAA